MSGEPVVIPDGDPTPVRVGSWLVKVLNDVDRHLTLMVAHDDRTAVLPLDWDADGFPWGERFSTQGTEDAYRQRRHEAVTPDSDQTTARVRIGPWLVLASNDVDEHLTLTVEHDDGTPVLPEGWDSDGFPWAERFSTQGAERQRRTS